MKRLLAREPNLIVQGVLQAKIASLQEDNTKYFSRSHNKLGHIMIINKCLLTIKDIHSNNWANFGLSISSQFKIGFVSILKFYITVNLFLSQFKFSHKVKQISYR